MEGFGLWAEIREKMRFIQQSVLFLVFRNIQPPIPHTCGSSKTLLCPGKNRACARSVGNDRLASTWKTSTASVEAAGQSSRLSCLPLTRDPARPTPTHQTRWEHHQPPPTLQHSAPHITQAAVAGREPEAHRFMGSARVVRRPQGSSGQMPLRHGSGSRLSAAEKVLRGLSRGRLERQTILKLI